MAGGPFAEKSKSAYGQFVATVLLTSVVSSVLILALFSATKHTEVLGLLPQTRQLEDNTDSDRIASILSLLRDVTSTEDLDGLAFFEKWKNGKVANYIKIGKGSDAESKLPVHFGADMDFVPAGKVVVDQGRNHIVPMIAFHTSEGCTETTVFNAMKSVNDLSELGTLGSLKKKFKPYFKRYIESWNLDILGEKFMFNKLNQFFKNGNGDPDFSLVDGNFIHAYVDIDTSEVVSFVKSFGVFTFENSQVKLAFRGCIIPYTVTDDVVDRLVNTHGVVMRTVYLDKEYGTYEQNIGDTIYASHNATAPEGKKTAFRYALLESTASNYEGHRDETDLEYCYTHAPQVWLGQTADFQAEFGKTNLASTGRKLNEIRSKLQKASAKFTY